MGHFDLKNGDFEDILFLSLQNSHRASFTINYTDAYFTTIHKRECGNATQHIRIAEHVAWSLCVMPNLWRIKISKYRKAIYEAWESIFYFVLTDIHICKVIQFTENNKYSVQHWYFELRFTLLARSRYLPQILFSLGNLWKMVMQIFRMSKHTVTMHIIY